MKTQYPTATKNIGKELALNIFTNIKFQDPAYRQLIFAVRIVITLGIAALYCKLTHEKETIWLIITAFFTAISQTDIGFKRQTIRLLVTGPLCVVGILIGSLAGNNHLILGIVLSVLLIGVYQTLRYSKLTFTLFLIPIFAIIVSGAYPTNLSGTFDRLIPAIIGAVIAIIAGITFFPYNTRKTLSAIIRAISYHMIDHFNYIFLSYLTGNRKISALTISTNQLLSLLNLMSQHLVYLNDQKLDSDTKAIFNLFSQGYFISRLLHEPSNPDQWLYFRTSLETVRKNIKQLIISWYQRDHAEIERYLNIVMKIKFTTNSKESDALLESIAKIAKSIQGLARCNL